MQSLTLSKLQIRKYFKIFGFLNLVMSLIYLLLVEKFDFIDRIVTAIGINFAYFIWYYFLSYLPFLQHRYIKNQKGNKLFGIQSYMITGFLKIVKWLGLILIIVSLVNLFLSQSRESSLFICVFIAFILGASMAQIKVNEIK
jgi:hypothetical protein